MSKFMQVRQGDVLLTQVKALPAAAVRKATDQGRVILAYGEVTGHAHEVQSDAEAVEAFLAELDGQTYLQTATPTRVVHQEHGAVALPTGTYRVTIQREYTPEAIRSVLD